MIRNLKLTVSYDGTPFLGWQLASNGPTIEKALKQCLEQLLQEKISLQAASRTDRGVHAEGQIVGFFTSQLLSESRLKRGLNALLPEQIRVTAVEQMALSFHPTLDSIGKEYIYRLELSEVASPLTRHFCWQIGACLNLEWMQECVSLFIGSHDFSSFCNSRKNMVYQDKTREIFSLEIEKIAQSTVIIKIAGNHFLYKMVRNIVGALVSVGLGKLKKEDLANIFEAKSRSQAPLTAPACGLTLTKIFYPEQIV